jgi:hypothetical protein
MVVRIQPAFAEAGKVLAASGNARGLEAAQELARITHHLDRITGDHPGGHHLARGFEGEVEHRGKVESEAQGARDLADDLAVTAIEPGIAGGENLACGGRWPYNVAETVHGSTLEIYTGEQRSFNRSLAVPQQLVRLLGIYDVAREKNDPGGLDAGKQRSQIG